MSRPGLKPILVVEGDGDLAAVPLLIRRWMSEYGLGGSPASRPLRAGDVKKLLRPGEIEKFAEYGCARSDGDSVLVLVDCDDDCPVEAAAQLVKRIRPIAERYDCRVGVILFHREFEVLFLAALEEMAEARKDLDWDLEDFEAERDWSEVRDAKGHFERRVRDFRYKPTRDQAAFAAALDLATAIQRNRSAQHLRDTLNWLVAPEASGHVYPVIEEASH